MSEPEDEYLISGAGTPDADVERLERLLRPLGRRDDAPIAPMPSRSRRARLYVMGALAAAAAAVVVVVMRRTDEATHDPPVVTTAAGPKIHEGVAGPAFGVGAWVETGDAAREISVGELGRVRLAARSRLQVRRVSDETTRLYLASGSLEATVSANAKPRFFQVDTDAARCVDLGCRYTLDVAESGVATVRVLLGQVAFTTETREVFVPAGASCVARRDRGPGTPRFDDAREAVVSAFDAYDAAPEEPAERRRLALAALDLVSQGRDTLPAWHLLQDTDAEIARAAAARLEVVAGRCQLGTDEPAAKVRNAWKEYLEAQCW